MKKTSSTKGDTMKKDLYNFTMDSLETIKGLTGTNKTLTLITSNGGRLNLRELTPLLPKNYQTLLKTGKETETHLYGRLYFTPDHHILINISDRKTGGNSSLQYTGKGNYYLSLKKGETERLIGLLNGETTTETYKTPKGRTTTRTTYTFPYTPYHWEETTQPHYYLLSIDTPEDSTEDSAED